MTKMSDTYNDEEDRAVVRSYLEGLGCTVTDMNETACFDLCVEGGYRPELRGSHEIGRKKWIDGPYPFWTMNGIHLEQRKWDVSLWPSCSMAGCKHDELIFWMLWWDRHAGMWFTGRDVEKAPIIAKPTRYARAGKAHGRLDGEPESFKEIPIEACRQVLFK